MYPCHFVNMLLIQHVKQQREKGISEVASIMRTGLSDRHSSCYKEFKTSKISDIFEPFQSEEGSVVDPKLILIDGAPGMGKTTICKEIAYQWAKGRLLKDVKVVFFLILRDPGMQRMYDLKDLIHYFYNFEPSYLDISKQCAKILTERDNSDITILMDGYDELGNNALLIKNILNRNILAQCKIVITSRPIASQKLNMLGDVRVEVLGFTENSKKEYIQQELEDNPEKILGLLSYLDSHNNINKVCYIPIMMTIMVCIFKEYEELPTNQSELYERFITLAILRCLQKLDDKLPEGILSLHKLPERYKIYINQLAEFAFKTIQSDKVIFSNIDMENLSPGLASSSKKFQGLGLLKATEHLSIKKMENCIWYNFMHLSIHEFLAAYHLNSLEISGQFQIFKNSFFIDHYLNVWLLFFGLQQNVSFDFHQFSAYLHIYGTSDMARNQMKSILQKLNLHEIAKIKLILIVLKELFNYFVVRTIMMISFNLM